MRDAGIFIVRATEENLNLGRQAVELHRETSQSVTDGDEESVRGFVRDSKGYLLMARQDDCVIGSLYGYALRHPHRAQPQFLLYAIDVSQEWRNRGIGTALVRHFVAEAKKARACEVWVLTEKGNAAALVMYEKNGFRRSGAGEIMFELNLDAESEVVKAETAG